jgi:hypothetical protein
MRLGAFLLSLGVLSRVTTSQILRHPLHRGGGGDDDVASSSTLNPDRPPPSVFGPSGEPPSRDTPPPTATETSDGFDDDYVAASPPTSWDLLHDDTFHEAMKLPDDDDERFHEDVVEPATTTSPYFRCAYRSENVCREMIAGKRPGHDVVDHDCCALPETARCAPGYRYSRGDRCFKDSCSTGYDTCCTKCVDPTADCDRDSPRYGKSVSCDNPLSYFMILAFIVGSCFCCGLFSTCFMRHSSHRYAVFLRDRHGAIYAAEGVAVAPPAPLEAAVTPANEANDDDGDVQLVEARPVEEPVPKTAVTAIPIR